MFASKTLTEHLARGVVGLGAFAHALMFANTSVLFPIVLIPVGLLALRGCPLCWTMGLGETVLAKLTGRPVGSACVDGQCAARRPPPSLDRMFRDLFEG